MAYPTVDNNHKAEALALLTDHYKGKLVVEGMIKTYTAPIQELETVIWQVINAFLLTSPPVGDQLDSLGTIVGAARLGLSDADYLAKIKLQIRVNRSAGLSEDIIQVAALALGHSADTYLDMKIAQYLVETWNVPSPNVLAQLLSHVDATGVRGVLHYTVWADGNDFKFSSRYQAGAGQGVWGSRYSGSTGGLMAAGAEL